MTTVPPIVVVGDLMVDVVATMGQPLQHGSDTTARVRRHGGGGGANVAAWLAHTGTPVVLVCRVGDDEPGRTAARDLTAAGVVVRQAVDPDGPTGTCVVLVHPGGERSMLPDRGANARLGPDDLPPDVLDPGGHLHLSGYVLLHATSRAAGVEALARARAAGMTTSVDPASAAPLHAMGAGELQRATGTVDLLKLNAEEAFALTGRDEPREAARALAARAAAREVVVTLGGAGALWTDGTDQQRAEATTVRADARDTTGAGDAFTAGWLAARVARAADPATALACANALAAEAVATPGGRPPG